MPLLNLTASLICAQAYMQGVGRRGRAVHWDALSVKWRGLIVNHSPEEPFSGNGPVVPTEIPCPLTRNQTNGFSGEHCLVTNSP